MKKEYRGQPHTNNADKARGAMNLKRKLLNEGVSQKDASNLAAHEFQHAVHGDKGRPGKFGYTREGNNVAPYYETQGLRTPRQALEVISAPRELSEGDVQKLTLANRIRNLMIAGAVGGCGFVCAALYFTR